MNDQSRLDLSNDWMTRAKSDLQLAKLGLQTTGVILEDACFHAQQFVEKALIAILTWNDIDFPRTHAIEVLLDLLKTNGVTIPNEIDESFALTHYTVQTRYPGKWEPITSDVAKKVVDQAEAVLIWVNKQFT
jgi:HEPN domain-containing protein